MLRAEFVALLALTVGAGGLAAQQQHQHGQPQDSMAAQQQPQRPGGMGMMQGMMQMPMMDAQGMAMMPAHGVMQRAMRLSPPQLLKNKDALDLMPEQIGRLQKLVSDDSATARERMAAMKRAQSELARLFDAPEPDAAAVQAAAEKLFAFHGAMHAQRIANAAKVRGILTSAQLEKAMLTPCAMSGMMGGGMMQGDKMQTMMQRGQGDAPGLQHEQHHPGRAGGNR